jgi:hypothetical protein
MAVYKYTAKYGETQRGQIAVASGAAEAQTDTISINIDRTNMGRAEVIHVIEKITQKILAENFPPL